MAVTTTPPTTKIFSIIKKDFGNITFKKADRFYWSSSTNTIFHKSIKNGSDLQFLMHEIAHYVLGHSEYEFDVHLTKYEAEAWQYATIAIAPKYGLRPDPELIEDSLDTYRHWLHQRSLCPNCKQTGLQQNKNTYSCLNCRCSWRVNEARLCGLRRIVLNSSLAAATD